MDKHAPSQNPAAHSIKVAFFIPDQYWSGSVSLLVDVLSGINMFIQQEANPSAPHYDMAFVHEPGRQPQGMSPCSFAMQALDDTRYDIVIIPAVWSLTPKELQAYQHLPAWLQHQHSFGAHFISVTNGAFFLAAAGLLTGKEITLHWAFQDLFRALFPTVRIKTTAQTLTLGRVWSSSGISPTMDLVKQLIRQYSGESLAQACTKYFMLDEHSQPPKDIAPAHKRDALVSAIISWLEQHYHRTINSQEIAEQFHMSYRNLNRRFRAETGQAPQEYLQAIRLERAAKLLASTRLSVEHVAVQCGYANASALGKVFKQRFTHSPSAYRKYMHANR